MEKESIKNESEDKDKNSFWDYFVSICMISMVGIIIFSVETYMFNNIIFYILVFLTVALMFIYPLSKAVKEKKKKGVLNTIDIFKVALSGSIALLILNIFYKIKNFEIEYWYKNHVFYDTTIICIICLIIIKVIKNFIKDLKDIPQLEKTKTKYLGKTIMFIISIMSLFVLPFYGVYEEKETIILNDMKIPVSLEVYVINEHSSKDQVSDYRKKIATIEDENKIKKLIDDLQGKNISNIRFFERLAYGYMEEKSTSYYEVNFKYEDFHRTVDYKKFQEGYMRNITLFNDGYATMEIKNSYRNSLKRIKYKKYKIPISESVIDKLIQNLNSSSI